jgi:hypothetical protein
MFEMAFTMVDWNSVTYRGEHIFSSSAQISYSYNFCDINRAAVLWKHMYVQLEVGYPIAFLC